jgi:hypothetical protein
MGIIMAGMFALFSARGATPYLPETGPAPLRFETAPSADAVLKWKPLLLTPVQPETNTNPPAPAANISVDATNASDVVVSKTDSAPVANTNSLVASVTNAPAPVAVSEENSNTAAAVNVTPLPAGSENSVNPVTPQILAEFFKPGRGGKNGNNAVVFVPADIQFTPPVPQSQSANQSRAVYKIEE